jgi:deoxyribodipyrimidine photolyase-related protein
VIYLRLDDPANQQSIAGSIASLIERHGFKRFEYQPPDEYRLRQDFSYWTACLSIDTRCCDSEHFLSNPEEFEKLFRGKKHNIL